MRYVRDPGTGKLTEVGAKRWKIVQLLSRPGGASLADLQAATGWKAQTLRGAIAGTIKRTLGYPVLAEETPAGRVYRIVGEPNPPPPEALRYR